VLAGDAKAGALPALQFPFIDKTPFLHRLHLMLGTSVLLQQGYLSQAQPVGS
jgi:hypothetical protein